MLLAPLLHLIGSVDPSEYLLGGLTSGATFVASDATAQLFLHRSARIQWFQLLRLGMFGFFVKGPLQSLYYSAVEAISPGRGSPLQVRPCLCEVTYKAVTGLKCLRSTPKALSVAGAEHSLRERFLYSPHWTTHWEHCGGVESI